MKKAEKEKKFWDILHEMRRNYNHSVCTMGSCHNEGCDNPARGGGTCPDCLEGEMAELLGDNPKASSIHYHTRQAWKTINDALEILE